MQRRLHKDLLLIFIAVFVRLILGVIFVTNCKIIYGKHFPIFSPFLRYAAS